MDSYPGPLEQIIINLVQNSIRHGFDGRNQGCITIRATLSTDKNNNQNVVIVFSDDGAGISPHNMDKIFEPFFTTRLGRGGSGIGLNIVHQIATSILEGAIEVQSELGSGTKFTLTIPCKIKSLN